MDRVYQIVIIVCFSFGIGLLAGVLGTHITNREAIDWATSARSRASV